MAIRHKRTTTTGYTWQAGDTVEGQIGLNLTDGTLHFKKANGVYVNISEGSGSGITDVVQDTTPQLGGNLDVNGNSIVSASNGDIAITPNGTGSVIIDGNEFPQTQGAKDDILVADGGGLLEWKKPEKLMAYVYNADSVQINKGEPVYVFSAFGDQISVKRALNTGDATSAQTLGLANENIATTASGYVVCQGPLTNVDTSAYTAGQALYLGATAGSVTTTKPSEPNHLVYLGFVEKINASSGRIYVRTQNGYELSEIHDVNINNATALADNHYLRYNSANTRWENAALDIVNDTTPQLGGNLDVNGNSIVSTANGNITIAPNGTGKVVISGDLQIDGTTTTVNSTTLDVDDINITIAKGAANAAAANGGGITLEGPTTAATITYASADDSWNLNKKTSVTELQVDNVNINGNTITSTDTNGNLVLTPNGTGDVQLNADTVRVGDSNANATITTNGTGDLILNTNSGTSSSYITVFDGAAGNIELTLDTGGAVIVNGGTAAPFVSITTDQNNITPIIGRHIATAADSITRPSVAVQKARSDVALASMTNDPAVLVYSVRDNVNTTRIFGRAMCRYQGASTQPQFEFQTSVNGFTNTAWVAKLNNTLAGFGGVTGSVGAGVEFNITTNSAASLKIDTNTGTNAGNITLTQGANGNISITPNGTGKTAITNLNYNETVFAIGNSGASTLTPNAANGPIQTITATGNFTLSTFTSPISGQTITFIITQDATGGRTLTSTMKFAGGSKTLSTAANAIDILTVSYIGTTYYATLSKGYA